MPSQDMTLGGDPAAVSAGAAQLTGLADRFTGGAEEVRGLGGRLGAAWRGDAGPVAAERVRQAGTTIATGAEVTRAAGPILEQYAQALREAQQEYAAARLALDAANDALLAAATGPSPAPAAEGGLQQDKTAAQAAMDAARAKEQQANQAAATSLDGLTAQLAGMTIPEGTPPGDVTLGLQSAPDTQLAVRTPAPAPVAGPRTVLDDGTLVHAALGAIGAVPGPGAPFALADAGYYAAQGRTGEASLAAAGAIPFGGPLVRGGRGLLAGARGTEELGVLGRTAGEVPTSGVPTAGRAVEEGTPTPAAGRNPTGGDPVDLGTGHLLMPATDVELPGVLPLVLGRFHHSRWRAGRWFGPSWASLLDTHLRVRDDDALLARWDAHVLAFPRAGGRAHDTPRWVFDGAVVTDLDTRRRHLFAGDAEHRWLTAIEDPSGHRIDIDRDDDGTPREVRHSAGHRVTVLTEGDRVVGYDLADVALVRFGYTAGNLTAVVDSTGLPLRLGYDDHARLTGWSDRIGTWFRHAYDADDRVVRQIGSGGALSSDYEYDDGSVTRIDGVGHRWTHEHDEHHRVVASVSPDGARATVTYDDDGLPVRTVDPLGAVTTHSYDAAGALVATVLPDGGSVRVERDPRGLPVVVTSPEGETHRAYDEAGRPVVEHGPAGETRWTYDARGGLASVTDALGTVTTVECDPAGLPVAATDPLGHRTTWERDAFGRVVAETDPLGARTTWTWTVEGRLAATTDPTGGTERRLYDGEGNLVALTDPAGGVRRWEYTHFDRCAAEIAADGTRTGYTWDAELRLVAVTAPGGLAWVYERDAAGRVVAETDFDGRRTEYTLDAAGRVAARLDALGQRTTYVHDVVGRLLERRAPGALSVFAHDAAGRVVRATTPDVDVVLERDAAGRVVSEAVNGRALTWTYDGLGRPVRRVTPAGVVSEWTYDAASRVRSLVAGVGVGFDHDAAGRETRRVAGAAAVLSGYDAAGRLTTLGGVVDRSFAYRADGVLAAAGERSFALDPVGRVVGVDGPRGTERYAYDALGNTVAASWPGADDVAGERPVVGTRVQRAGRTTYAYDALGRVVRRTRRRLSHRPDTWHYEWDAADRLLAVRTPDGARWEYRYDAFGRRVSKRGPAGQVDFTWDGTTLVEQVEQVVHAPDGVSSTTWDHRDLRPVVQRERLGRADQDEIDERFYAVVTDLVGAPTELVSPAGEVVGRASRSLWGRTVWSGVSSPLLFPGQYEDPETGWADNLHRQYDPDTARYASPDPLGLAPAPNPVAYVHNPHTWSDPLGLNGCGLRPGEPLGGVPYRRFVEGIEQDGTRYPIDTGSPQLHAQIEDVLRRKDLPIDQRGLLRNSTFRNSPARGPGTEVLPVRRDVPNYYREYDIWNDVRSTRGSERLVVGKDGDVWYTYDHYRSARRIR